MNYQFKPGFWHEEGEYVVRHPEKESPYHDLVYEFWSDIHTFMRNSPSIDAAATVDYRFASALASLKSIIKSCKVNEWITDEEKVEVVERMLSYDHGIVAAWLVREWVVPLPDTEEEWAYMDKRFRRFQWSAKKGVAEWAEETLSEWKSEWQLKELKHLVTQKLPEPSNVKMSKIL
jgi:hypothetical protein